MSNRPIPKIEQAFDGAMPSVSKKERHCPICKVKLSSYNLNKYCFSHTVRGAKIDDEKMQDYKTKYYKKRAKMVKKEKNK